MVSQQLPVSSWRVRLTSIVFCALRTLRLCDIRSLRLCSAAMAWLLSRARGPEEERMHRRLWRAILLLVVGVGFLAVPNMVAAQAQTAIAGVARDTTGAVVPGVTVEVSSPAIIEGTRVAVTDANGRYRVVDLRPGTYTVVFTLSGFSTRPAGRNRAHRELRGAGERRAAGRRARGDHHGHGRVADRGRGELDARGGADTRAARRDPDGPRFHHHGQRAPLGQHGAVRRGRQLDESAGDADGVRRPWRGLERPD